MDKFKQTVVKRTSGQSEWNAHFWMRILNEGRDPLFVWRTYKCTSWTEPKTEFLNRFGIDSGWDCRLLPTPNESHCRGQPELSHVSAAAVPTRLAKIPTRMRISEVMETPLSRCFTCFQDPSRIILHDTNFLAMFQLRHSNPKHCFGFFLSSLN